MTWDLCRLSECGWGDTGMRDGSEASGENGKKYK